MGSIGQGARRRERKYKGRRGEGGSQGKEVVKEGPQELEGGKGPERMNKDQIPKFYLKGFFHITRRETGWMRLWVASSIPHSLAHSCQHKKGGCDGVSAPQCK